MSENRESPDKRKFVLYGNRESATTRARRMYTEKFPDRKQKQKPDAKK